MNLVNSVFEIAESFMDSPKYVDINHKHINITADLLKDVSPPKFPFSNPPDVYKTCLMELVSDALNYCYWYGRADIRPHNSCSGKLQEKIILAFDKFDKNGGIYSFDSCLDKLIKILSIERFPLLSERIGHINELRNNGQPFISKIIKHQTKIEEHLNDMVQIFPGYASDMFLKRAFLFFAQLNRFFGWFEEDMNELPIPADYQVPKMLEAEGILTYHYDLKTLIQHEDLIPKGSIYECEIRAASIIACDKLRRKIGWTMPQIDGYFWLRRKDVTTPFHLTVTTDY